MPDQGTVPSVLVVDRRWRVDDSGRRCRFPRCGGVAVARLNRGRTVRLDGYETRQAPSWWHYCADHLYGRVIVGDEVMIGVHPESPAAERGWIE